MTNEELCERVLPKRNLEDICMEGRAIAIDDRERLLKALTQGILIPAENVAELRNRVATLLKASEGMEKALEKIATHGYSDAPELEQDQHQIAQSALADFRAVKKTMEKGAWK